MKLAFVPVCAGFALTLAGCAGRDTAPEPEAATPAGEPDWRTIITPADRSRLRQWRSAWVEGLGKARASGKGAEVAAEGALLDPDAAAAWRAPPSGDYHCRVIKIGGKSQGMLDYVAYPAFTCRLRQEDSLMSFAKLTGSQRPIGMILPYAENRMLFLGTLQLGDESRALQYGRDRERDMVGLLERVDERRWRLVFPYPRFESTVDILELIPKS